MKERMRRYACALAGFFALTRCGGEVESASHSKSTAGPPVETGAGAGAVGANAAAGGSTAPGTGGSTPTSAATTTSPANLPESATLKLDAFTLAPGDEAFYCQTFADPFGAANVDLDR